MYYWAENVYWARILEHMIDFTIDKYIELLNALEQSGVQYKLRHDVDLRPENSLKTALIEHSMNIKSTYYFRAVAQSYDEQIIKKIANLGHEIGYHYESLTTVNGDLEQAYTDFKTNLERFRKIAVIQSICMHGSPRSPWDSRDLWKYYNYHDLGLLYEPYMDTDWSNTLYLTDTGRRWDGYKVSVRDKIPQWQEQWDKQGLTFHSTDQIIAALKDPYSTLRQSKLEMHITTHPQRWNNIGARWLRELVVQNIKNIVKRCLNKKA